MAEPAPGAIRYANLKKEISLEGIKSVLNDGEFSEIIDPI